MFDFRVSGWCVAWAAVGLAAAAQEETFAPAALPPIVPWTGASEARVVGADHPWVTPSESTDLVDSPDYAETLAYLEQLCRASNRLELKVFGRTAEGRDLYVVIARSEDRSRDKPVVLAQAGIHSGEIDGKDAGLMLLRDLTLGGKMEILEKVDFLFVPVFNLDGHERRSLYNRPNQRGPIHQGWRTTSRNLNLNRDYLKADSPEMQAMLGLIREWEPDLYLDLHVTDGIDYQYDITFGYNGYDGNPAWSPRIGVWLDEILRPEATKALLDGGHVPGRLVFATDDRDPAKGIGLGSTMPRFSEGYGDLRHLPTILVENHSLKPYRQRVLGTCVLLEAVLRCVGENAASLKEAIATDRAARPKTVPLQWVMIEEGRLIDFLGMEYERFLSGVTGEEEVRWLGQPVIYRDYPMKTGAVGTTAERPVAYWVPGVWSEVIERLRLHGVEMEEVPEPTRMVVSRLRLVEPKVAAVPYEGRHKISAEFKVERREEVLPKGTFRIPTDQPLGDLVVVALEPTSPASFFAWGFFPEILQQTEYIEGYVMDPLAERMMAEDPDLREAFSRALMEDPELAGSREARLRWFYARTPYFDDRYLLYPVAIEGRVD